MFDCSTEKENYHSSLIVEIILVPYLVYEFTGPEIRFAFFVLFVSNL